MPKRHQAASSGDAGLDALLRSWRDSLIDLSFRNRLLNYQRRASSVGMDLIQPGVVEILEGVGRGCRFAPVPEPSDEGDDGRADGVAMAASAPGGPVPNSLTSSRPLDTPASRAGVGRGRPLITITTSKATQAEQDRHLRRLATVAREKFNDYGLWVLHLGVGFVDWTPAPSAEKSFSSPLVMVPVVLERRRGGGDSYILKINTNEESALNPALSVKMAEMGLAWPQAEQVETRDIPELITQARRAVQGLRNWQVSTRIVLDTFNSSKEVMYRDLLDNAERVWSSDLVRAVGLGPSSGLPPQTFAFEPADVERIDTIQPPEQTPLVLDADSSQRQSVAAAVEGRSFVMDGPPGTGKSQTITNMIAALLERGRTMLFVSEKAAALDVVRNRLNDVGLDDYVLALHSNSTGRKQVAKELGRALDAPRRTLSGGARAELTRAREVREELSGYAAAMNDPHPDLGVSLHHVLGRIALLDDGQPLPAGTRFDAAHLTAEDLDRTITAARQVARSWRPAVEGTAFAWRALTGSRDPLHALDVATESLQRLQAALTPHSDLLAELSWDGVSEASRLAAALHHAEDRPGVPKHWLTADQKALTSAITGFLIRLDAVADTEAPAEKRLGETWDRLPEGLPAESTGDETALATLVPEGIDLTALTATAARTLADQLEADAEMLERAAQALTGVARIYGLPSPETCGEALRLGRLAALSGFTDEAKPLPGWLSPDGLAEARTAAGTLRAAVSRLAAARTKAEAHFTARALEEDRLSDVADRFATVHHSLTGRLTSAYRADRRLVRALLHGSGKCTQEVIAALPDAVAWQHADRAFKEADRTYGTALGRHWKGEDTDVALVDSLISRASEINDLAPVVLDRECLAREVASGGVCRPAARRTAETTATALSKWRDRLVFPPESGPSFELETGKLQAVAAWSRAHVAPLRAAERVLRVVEETAAPDTLAADRTWTLGTAREAIRTVHAARSAIADFEAGADGDRALLGGLYEGRVTSGSNLAAALHWRTELSRACGLRGDQGLSESGAEIMYSAGADEELDTAHQEWARDSTALASMFQPGRAAELSATFTRDTGSALAALAVLDGDRGGPDEWRAYDHGRRVLDELGHGDLVDRAVRLAVAREHFPKVVERAALRAWADVRLDQDPRLGTTRSADREALVERFRDLDSALAHHARARVIQACDQRRPRTANGPGAALLKREGEKKSRHKPVRELLDVARETVPLIKPCFMMSPLTVSRFLPPDLMFDVVIFDEASQVLPQDAVNCIYRGRSLIVAGDENQLPPTAFFSSLGDEEENQAEEVPERFESVLKLCKASGLLPSLSLRWHYRSRHEDLIAFSNREFYGESMTTFPGALADGPDVGVAFFRARNGAYRSGAAARDNPGEATFVAERVIHHFTTRKGKSLGVVTLSQAQAVAVQDAVDAGRSKRPDLDEWFSEDRLDGFFVKNLETVQGDERDVMIMSVGYGPDSAGKFSMNFGPVNNNEHGWRRLNVAATRARYRVEVIASFDPGDMHETSSKSLRHFQRYLHYAQRGPDVLAQNALDPDAEPESPFEESVLSVLRGWGYDVQPQVGVAGYRIDLGIRHPESPGLYVLGVECDGAMYHSSKAARDRDRLRESVLRALGWDLHRIWGTDWYRDRAGAEARLRSAVERATAVPAPPRAPATVTDVVAAEGTGTGRCQGTPKAERARHVILPVRRSPAPRAVDAPAPAAHAGSRAASFPTSTLAHGSRQRVMSELDQIKAELTQTDPDDATADPRVRADNTKRRALLRERLEDRAEFLRSFLAAVPAADRTAAGQLVAPGRLVGLVFGDSSSVEEFEITAQRPSKENAETLSPFTALGAALLWQQAGHTVEYSDGAGSRRTVSIQHVRD